MIIETLRQTRRLRKAYFELNETWKFFGFDQGSYRALFEMVWPIIENLATEKEKELVNVTDLDAIISKHNKLEEQRKAINEYVLFVSENNFLTSREKVKIIKETKNEVLANLKLNSDKLKDEVKPQLTVIANILREIEKATHRAKENMLLPIGERNLNIENFLKPFEDRDYIDGYYTLKNIADWIDTQANQFNINYRFSLSISNIPSSYMERAQVNYTGLEKDNIFLRERFWEKIRAEAKYENEAIERILNKLIEEARHEMEMEWIQKNHQAHRELINQTQPTTSASWFDKVKQGLSKIQS